MKKMNNIGYVVAVVAICMAMAANASTIRVTGGTWYLVNNKVTATNFIIGSSATLSGAGEVRAPVDLAGTVSPGINAEDIGNLSFSDKLVFNSGTFICHAATDTSLDRISVTGNVTGAGTVLMTRSAGVSPVRQIIINGGAASTYSSLVPSPVSEWTLDTSNALDLVVSLGIAAPQNVSASDGTYTNKITLTWSTVSGASAYQVWRNTVADSSLATMIAIAAQTNYDDTTPAAGILYYYWVKSVNATYTSAFSSSDLGYLSGTDIILDPPAGVSASYGTYSNKVRVSWNTATNAASYEVWRHTTNDSSVASLIIEVSTNYYDDSSVTVNVSYYYWVKSKNALTSSVFSAGASGYASGGGGGTDTADLRVTDLLFLPLMVSTGSHPGTVTFYIYNLGPDALADDNTRVQADFYLSRDTTLGDDNDAWLGDYSLDVTLAADSGTMVIVPQAGLAGITIPGGLSGSYYVFVRVRPVTPSTLTDPDLSNNDAMRSGAITVIFGAPTINHIFNDFDGDGKTDVAVFELPTGYWYIFNSGTLSMATMKFGNSSVTPISGDYDGDGKTDITVFEPATGYWYIFYSSTLSMATMKFGNSSVTPISGDYDGDGKADITVFEPATGYWYIFYSSTLSMATMKFGNSSVTPVSGDYDGDGKTDITVFENATGYWYIFSSSTLSMSLTPFGNSDCTPLAGDFDGDGKTDLTVFERTTGYWYILYSSTVTMGTMKFGNSSVTPMPGDYDGDGKTDVAVFENATGYWYIFYSSTLEMAVMPFGSSDCVLISR